MRLLVVLGRHHDEELGQRRDLVVLGERRAQTLARTAPRLVQDQPARARASASRSASTAKGPRSRQRAYMMGLPELAAACLACSHECHSILSPQPWPASDAASTDTHTSANNTTIETRLNILATGR